MSRNLVLVPLLCAACVPVQRAVPVPDVPRLAFTNVDVVDVESGRVLPEQTVLIAGNRIHAVGPSTGVRVPRGAQVVEGRGKYLIPGLWDMHVHTMREGRAARFFPLFVANGVTSVREMGTFLDSLAHWRSRADAGMLAPRIAAAGHIVNGPPPAGAQRPPVGQPTPAWVYSFAAATPGAARSAVDTLVARRVDFVKPYSGLSRDTYFALAQAARERGIPLAGHVPAAVTPAEAADAGQRTMEHLLGIMESCVPDWDRRLQELVGLLRGPDAASDSGREAARRVTRQIFEAYSRELCDPLFARFREKDVYHTPTLVQLRGLSRRQEQAARSDHRLRFVPPSVRERWQPRPGGDSLRLLDTYHAYVKLLGELHRSGVPILAGTDASDEAYVFPGSSLHEEMETFVRAGMTPLESLRAATRNPARALGLEDSIGSVERGKLADLVLLDGNPLEEIRNTQRISAVVLNGRYLDRRALDALLAEVERIASAPAD